MTEQWSQQARKIKTSQQGREKLKETEAEQEKDRLTPDQRGEGTERWGRSVQRRAAGHVSPGQFFRSQQDRGFQSEGLLCRTQLIL